MSRCSAHLFLVASLLAGMLSDRANGEAARQSLSLDGEWNFATDPDNRGETDKWFARDTKLPAMPLPGYAPEANGTIRVPGIWDNQGYGVETEKVRHNFVGKGWYKRQIEIPQSWAGRRMFLTITGVNRYSKVWVNDHFLGEHIGYLSAQEYEVSSQVVPGKTATIAIQVDSKQRWQVDSMCGCSSLIDYMDVAWGGIWGHVSLEARADCFLSDLFAQADVADSSCTVGATLNGKPHLVDAARLDVLDKNGKRVAEKLLQMDRLIASGQPITVKAVIPNAKLWSPDSPTLYTARLSLLKGGRALDTVESRFGMRHFSTDGPYLLLNGKRLMLRGYGDDHIYPEQMAMPSDKELHLKQLRIIKSYGFNHVRHHSTIMPPEYYDACDEVGIIATAEFPIAYERFIPGSGGQWKANVKPKTDPKPALDTYHREWAAAIMRHRNHPSILCWVMGNELYPNFSIRYSFRDIAKKLDPQRLYLDSDGVSAALLANPKRDRPTVAIYDIQFAEWTDPIMNKDKFKTPKPIKPTLSHEAGNYVAFSRPDLIDQFSHNIKPFWLTASRETIETMGMLRECNQWAEKSERLCALLHKYNLESLRKNPYLSGYHWWLFQDYWTSSNGIVDHYFRPKSITKEEVLKYNAEVVVLQDGLERTYRGKTHLQLKLLVSNFAPCVLEGKLLYEVKAGERSLVQKQVALKAVPQGELVKITTIDLELPNVASPVALKINATVVSSDRQFANDWATRLYPVAIKPQTRSVPIFADRAKAKQFVGWGVRPMPSDGDLPVHAVYLAGSLDKRMLDVMNAGACVVLCDGDGRCQGKNLVGGLIEAKHVVTLDGNRPFLKSYPVTFRTSWWKAGDNREENNTGTFVYDHPATKAMAPDGWCDDGWYHLLEGGCKFDLEKAPARPEVLVRALTSLALPADEALLFEVGVGKGSLIVSGLNHRAAKGRPENEWILAKLLEHATTMPQPKAKWPASCLIGN